MEPRPPIPAPTPAPSPLASDAQVPDEGIDLSLVRWSLSLTPQERLDVLQRNVDALTRLRDDAAAQR